MKRTIFFWTVSMVICGAFSSASQNHHLKKHHSHRQFRDLETSSTDSPQTSPPEDSSTIGSNPGDTIDTLPPQIYPGSRPPYVCPLCLFVCLDTTSTSITETETETTSVYPTIPARRHKNVAKKSHYKKHYFVRHDSRYRCPPCGCYYPPTTTYSSTSSTEEPTETTTYVADKRKRHNLHHVKHQVLKKKHHNGH